MSLAEPHLNTLSDCCCLGYGSAPDISLGTCCGLPITPSNSLSPLTVQPCQWPSMIAKQHSSDSGLPHISPSGLMQVSRIHSTLKPSTGGTAHRKILTNKDRQEICLYREEHKTAKQKDIAGNVDLRTHVRIP